MTKTAERKRAKSKRIGKADVTGRSPGVACFDCDREERETQTLLPLGLGRYRTRHTGQPKSTQKHGGWQADPAGYVVNLRPQWTT